MARFEAEPVRQAEKFVIKNWWWEPEVKPDHNMMETIEQEMTRFAEVLQVDNLLENKEKLGEATACTSL